MPPPEEDYVDAIMEELDDVGDDYEDDDDDDDDTELIGQLVTVGAIDEVGARRITSLRSPGARKRMMRKIMRKYRRRIPTGAGPLPSPPWGRSGRDIERRAPLGFVEDGTGAFFFSLAGAIGATTTMRAKVSRAAHPDRLLIVPSAPGAVLQSVQVGDEEQLLSSGAPVELYSTAALTDAVPDNFSPVGPALDFVVTIFNTTAGVITGTIGIKANVKR